MTKELRYVMNAILPATHAFNQNKIVYLVEAI